MGVNDAATAAGVITERQKRWFATVRANFERDSGRSMADWVAIARTCPHEGHRARRIWLKEEHGLGMNHASFVLSEAFPSDDRWDNPDGLRAGLWKDAASRSILEALEARAVAPLDGLVQGQRKGYTSWSREVQFAAARPLRGGRALLGLKLDPALSVRLERSVRKESWSERLVSIVELDGPDSVDNEIARLFTAASRNG